MYLSGQALATISGLSLSSENYKETIEILTNRYGNTQVLVSVHMDSLLKITKIKDFNYLEGLKLGHKSKFYHFNYICFQYYGKYHISICNKKQTQTSATIVGVSDSTLLQTIKDKFFNNSVSKHVIFRILFDIGSQRSYITKDVCKRLKLKTIKREDMIKKTFGQ